MSFKSILLENYSSFIEALLHKDYSVTYVSSNADTIVNPIGGHYLGKQIIINLPIEIPSEQLLRYCKVYSRFPIGYGIPVIPFELPKDRIKIPKENYSLLILSPELMMDVRYSDLIHNNNFLIGINESIDDEATLVGYKILTNKVEEL
jgi:hypothetical protein